MGRRPFPGLLLIQFLQERGFKICESNAIETIMAQDCDELLGSSVKIQQTDQVPPSIAEYYLGEVLDIDPKQFWQYIEGK
jgi:hypothetical protein